MSTACRSAPHRAIIGCLRVALGNPARPGLAEDLRASPPMRLAAIAQVNHVHTGLATALVRAPGLSEAIPEDLGLYFAEMQAANRRRNAAGRAQLARIGAALDAEGIRAVALKGAAELLAPTWPDADARFLSDLDLLVPGDRAEEAVAALCRAGGTVVRDISDLDRPGHHHLDPVAFPGAPFAVEIHRHVGRGLTRELLPAGAVLDRALPAGTGLAVPVLSDRMLHHVAHAHGAPASVGRGGLHLRTLLDHRHLRAAAGPDTLCAVQARLASSAVQAGAEVLDALAGCCFGEMSGAPCSRRAEIAADRALRRFGQPVGRRLADTLAWLGHYLRAAATEPERRRHYLRRLATRDGRRAVLALHRERLTRFR